MFILAIDIKNVSKSFITKDKDFMALKDVNLHVDDGELICLLGPSGCGKTTLLRMVAGLEEPDEGEIYDRGELVEGPSKERGFIFQQYSLFPWLNVLDNVMFGLNLSGEHSKEENLAAAERYLEQRVAIIRSLLNHTPVLLMDEPFSAVDMLNRHTLQEQLIGVWKRFETTILFVTHDVDEAVYLADKIVIMDKRPGRIKDVVEVPLERPRQRESREFLDFQDEVEKLLGVWEP